MTAKACVATVPASQVAAVLLPHMNCTGQNTLFADDSIVSIEPCPLKSKHELPMKVYRRLTAAGPANAERYR